VLASRRVDELDALLQGERRSAAVLPSILAAIGKTPLVRLHLPGVPDGIEPFAFAP